MNAVHSPQYGANTINERIKTIYKFTVFYKTCMNLVHISRPDWFIPIKFNKAPIIGLTEVQ